MQRGQRSGLRIPPVILKIASLGGTITRQRQNITLACRRIPRARGVVPFTGSHPPRLGRAFPRLAAAVIRGAITALGQVTITRRLVAVGRELIEVGRALVLISADLITIRKGLLSVRRGLIQTRARPIVFGFWLARDHHIRFPAHAASRADQSARKLKVMHRPRDATNPSLRADRVCRWREFRFGVEGPDRRASPHLDSTRRTATCVSKRKLLRRISTPPALRSPPRRRRRPHPRRNWPREVQRMGLRRVGGRERW